MFVSKNKNRKIVERVDELSSDTGDIKQASSHTHASPPIVEKVVPLPKDLPTFDAYGDVAQQMRLIERVCFGDGLSENQYIRALIKVTRFDDAACNFAYSLYEENADWNTIKRRFIDRFSFRDGAVTAMEELWKLKQGANERPDLYAERFRAAMQLANRTNEDPAIFQQIKESLNDETKLEFRKYELQCKLTDQVLTTNVNLVINFLKNLQAVRAIENKMKIEQSKHGNFSNSNKTTKLMNTNPSTDWAKKPFCKRCGAHHEWRKHIVEVDAVKSVGIAHMVAHRPSDMETRKRVNEDSSPATAYKRPNVETYSGGNLTLSNDTCSVCGRAGHTAAKCFKVVGYPSQKQKFTEVKHDTESKKGVPTKLVQTQLIRDQEELWIPLKVNDRQVNAIVDLGAARSIIDEDVARSFGSEIKATDLVMIGADRRQGRQPFLGTIMVSIESSNSRLKTEVLIAQLNDAPLLIGRDLSSKLGIGLPILLEKPKPAHEDDKESVATTSAAIDAKDEHLETLIKGKIQNQLQANASISDKTFCSADISLTRLPMTDRDPIFLKQYKIVESLKEQASAQIKEWLRTGRVRHATPGCAWNLPITVVQKYKDAKPNGVRVCLDTRKINARCKNKVYPLPLIEDLVNKIARYEIFAELDLESAFTQFPLAEEDQDVLSFSFEVDGRIQHFSFCSAIFGLLFMSNHFQYVMDSIFKSHTDVFIYVDNIIVATRRDETVVNAETNPDTELIDLHARKISQVIDVLSNYNLRLNTSKCRFAAKRLCILGHLVSHNRIELDPKKVQSLIEWPLPHSKQELESFIGLFNYLRGNVPNASDVLNPLDAAKNDPECNKLLNQEDFIRNFEDAQAALADAIIRRPIVTGVPFIVATDASATGIGATLLQGQSFKGSNVVALASRRLLKYERRYPVFKRELLAIIFALRKFREYLFGQTFKLLTDHRALQYLLTAQPLHPTLASWLSDILEFDFEVIHIPGSMNFLADALSRAGERNSTVRVATVALNSEKLLSEVHNLHMQGHFGKRSLLNDLTLRKHRQDKELRSIVDQIVDNCEVCQRFNEARTGYHPLSSTVPEHPWQYLQIDLSTGLPKTKKGNQYLLVCVCQFSKFTILKPLVDKSSRATAAALIEIFSMFGLPNHIQTDEGKEFINNVWDEIFNTFKIERRPTIPYTPRLQGGAERHIAIAVNMIKKMLNGANVHWDIILPAVQFFINDRIALPLNSAPFAVMFARPAQTTTQTSTEQWLERQKHALTVIYPQLKSLIQTASIRSNQQFMKSHKLLKHDVPIGSRVMIRDVQKTSKLEPTFVGDFKVMQRLTNGGYILVDSTGDILPRVVDITHMKVVQRAAAKNERAYEFDSIIGHKGPFNNRLYLIKWKGDYSPS